MAVEHNPVGWFEIPVSDMERARDFYAHILGLALEAHRNGVLEMAWFPMRDDGVGAAGSLVKGEHYRPSSDGVLVYFSTPDITAALDRVEARGGQVIAEKTAIGAYGFIGLAQDTEGNRFGLHSPT